MTLDTATQSTSSTEHWPHEITLDERFWRNRIAEEILDYAGMTQVHVDSSGDGRGACLPGTADRCDITAALRVLAQRVRRAGTSVAVSER